MQELETAELPVVLKLTKSPAQEGLSVPHHLPKPIREMLYYLEQRKHNARFEWAFYSFCLLLFAYPVFNSPRKLYGPKGLYNGIERPYPMGPSCQPQALPSSDDRRLVGYDPDSAVSIPPPSGLVT